VLVASRNFGSPGSVRIAQQTQKMWVKLRNFDKPPGKGVMKKTVPLVVLLVVAGKLSVGNCLAQDVASALPV